MDRVLCQLLIAAALCICTRSQLTVPQPNLCCGRSFQPASSSAVIDGGQILTQGTYNVLEILACSTASFDLQVWKDLDPNYELVFTRRITPTLEHKINAVRLDPPISITDNSVYMVGMVATTQSGNFSVPFTAVDTDTTMIITAPASNTWTVGYTSGADMVRFRRTFKDFFSIWFCNSTSISECRGSVDMASMDPQSASMDDTPVSESCCGVGARGPPGPPGNCGANDALGDYISQQNGQLQQITEEVITMKNVLTSIQAESQPLGVCRPFYDTQFGDYSCYRFMNTKMELASYVFACANDSAYLVAIKSREKERYLVRTINNNRSNISETVCYHTAGMYDAEDSKWKWRTSQSIFNRELVNVEVYYKNFRYLTIPKPSNDKDQCIAFCVREYSSYWLKMSCHEKLRGICEHPKSCY